MPDIMPGFRVYKGPGDCELHFFDDMSDGPGATLETLQTPGRFKKEWRGRCLQLTL